jgi:predicted nuclease of restriction endonuclease-like (RecB) superfamily
LRPPKSTSDIPEIEQRSLIEKGLGATRNDVKKASKRARRVVAKTKSEMAQADFDEVIRLIDTARTRAVSAVNSTLIELYWSVGQYISRKIESTAWGEGVVDQLAEYIARTHPALRGFTRRNLFRMRQFYDTYQDDEKVSPLVTQLSWTHNLLILSRSKRPEEREFYLQMSVRERWSKRELERQLAGALFERVVLAPTVLSPPLKERYPDAASVFKDSYLVEFLDLPTTHSEDDLQRGLVEQLKKFLIELGRDFCFVGSQYPLQVGGRDFALDLLFFNRALNSLVAIELKVVEFELEHLGKLQFYLEALDRDVKKPHEKPSIGVLLCATKNHEVVEFALSRTMSPALIAEYQTKMPEKKLLEAKLHEFYELAELESECPAIEPKPFAPDVPKSLKGARKKRPRK